MSVYFKDILGQDAHKQRLADSVRQSKLAHTLLLSSSDGGAALPMALALARYVQCSDKSERDACGECVSCKQWDKFSHPDVHFSFPFASSKTDKISKSIDLIENFRQALHDGSYLSSERWIRESGAEKKTVLIPKNEAEDLFHGMKYKSFQGGFRIGIIWQPELLNVNASNFLLKLLEEPNDKSLFILVSAQPEKLLPTIISRCQQLRFLGNKPEEISLYLQEQKGLDESQASMISGACDGVLGKALALLEESNGNNQFTEFRNWMRMCFAKDLEGLTLWAEKMQLESRDAVRSFLRYSLDLLHKCLWLNSRGELRNVLSEEEKTFLNKFSPFMAGQKLAKGQSYFEGAIADLAWNGSAKIIFTDLSYKLMVLLKK